MPISNVNKRAERNLDHVAERFAAALHVHEPIEKPYDLTRRLYTPNIPEFECMVFAYNKKQRLFASLFDLTILVADSTESSSFPLQPDLMARFAKSIAFEKGKFVAKDQSCEAIATSMNCELVQKRIKESGVLDITLEIASDCSWRIALRQMVGSSTWNLIPPVMQLVDPREDDCLRTAELLRMFAAATRSALSMKDTEQRAFTQH